jgi:hypothetical protein
VRQIPSFIWAVNMDASRVSDTLEVLCQSLHRVDELAAYIGF